MGCLIIVSFLRSSPCQRNSLADFAHANSLCTWGAIGKYQTTFYGTSSGLSTLIWRPFLVPWSFTLGALVQVFVFFSTVQYAIIGTRVDFSTSRPMGQIICLAKYVFSGYLFFSGSIFLIIPNNWSKPLSLNLFVDLNYNSMMSTSSLLIGQFLYNSVLPSCLIFSSKLLSPSTTCCSRRHIQYVT